MEDQPRGRRAALAVGVTAAVCAVAALLWVFPSLVETDRAPGPAPSSAPSAAPAADRAPASPSGTAAAVTVRAVAPDGTGRPPVWLTAGAGQGPLLRIDPVTNTVTATVDVGPNPQQVVRVGRNAWVAGGQDGTLVEVVPDGTSARRLRTLPLGGTPTSLVHADASLWVLDEDGRLLAVEPETGRTTRAVRLGKGPFSGLAFDGTRLWTGAFSGRRILAVDPATGRVTARVATAHRPGTLAVAGGLVWVGMDSENSVTAFDPRTGRTVRSVRLGDPLPDAFTSVPFSLAGYADRLWVCTIASPGSPGWVVAAVDPATGRIAGRAGTQSLSMPPAADGHHLWVHSGTDVVRIDTRTLEEVTTTVDAAGTAPSGGAVASSG